MAYKDFEIFSGKELSSLLKDIYTNSKSKDKQINDLVAELHPLITSVEDATMLVPVIKEYLDVAVKNDKQLVELANVIQKLVATENKLNILDNNEYGLSDREKEELLKKLTKPDIDKIKEQDKEIKEKINIFKDKDTLEGY